MQPLFQEDFDRIKCLWAAVLASAYRDCYGRQVKGYGDDSRDARRWVSTENHEIGGFDWICQAFDIHPKALRERILTTKPKKKYAPVHGLYEGVFRYHQKKLRESEVKNG